MNPYVTITECVDRAGQQYTDNPRSKLSRTLEQWARDSDLVDIRNGIYDLTAAAHRWIMAGFLRSDFLPVDGPYAWMRDTPEAAYGIWLTARTLTGLPPV